MMGKLNLVLIVFVSATNMISCQTPSDSSSRLSELLQKNPSFQQFLSQNPAINQLLLSNPALIQQFELNPNLITQTVNHAKFLNTFLEENANLGQIIKQNPYVYAFILKQVDHAVETGQNSTIVIQMSEAEVQAQQRELEAQQQLQEVSHKTVVSNNTVSNGNTAGQSLGASNATLQATGGATGSNATPQSAGLATSGNMNVIGAPQPAGVASAGNVNVSGETHQKDALAGLSREQLLVLLNTLQASSQTQTLHIPNKLPTTSNENVFLHQTSFPKQDPAVIPIYKPSPNVQSSQTSHSSSVDPELNFAMFNAKPNGPVKQSTNAATKLSPSSQYNVNLNSNGINSVNSNGINSGYGNGVSGATNDMINPNSLADLTKLKMLYIAMYNREPASIQELQTFYTEVLVKLDIRTRKQVTEFLDKFKNVHTSNKNNSGAGSQSQQTVGTRPSGYSVSYVTEPAYPSRPTHKERKLQCKLRRFCRLNPSSAMCQRQRIEKIEVAYENQ